MMKQWLVRRAVRSPVSRLTTSAINSSVWRLPFISTSACPLRTSPTALAADSWLNDESTCRNGDRSRLARSATSRSRDAGPTRIGSMRPRRAASTTACSEDSSQG